MILTLNKEEMIMYKNMVLNKIDEFLNKEGFNLIKKGDKTAYDEFYEWDEVVKLYIAPPKKYKKPDLLNGMKW